LNSDLGYFLSSITCLGDSILFIPTLRASHSQSPGGERIVAGFKPNKSQRIPPFKGLTVPYFICSESNTAVVAILPLAGDADLHPEGKDVVTLALEIVLDVEVVVANSLLINIPVGESLGSANMRAVAATTVFDYAVLAVNEDRGLDNVVERVPDIDLDDDLGVLVLLVELHDEGAEGIVVQLKGTGDSDLEIMLDIGVVVTLAVLALLVARVFAELVQTVGVSTLAVDDNLSALAGDVKLLALGSPTTNSLSWSQGFARLDTSWQLGLALAASLCCAVLRARLVRLVAIWPRALRLLTALAGLQTRFGARWAGRGRSRAGRAFGAAVAEREPASSSRLLDGLVVESETLAIEVDVQLNLGIEDPATLVLGWAHVMRAMAVQALVGEAAAETTMAIGVAVMKAERR
jgi:hypothetical protein